MSSEYLPAWLEPFVNPLKKQSVQWFYEESEGIRQQIAKKEPLQQIYTVIAGLIRRAAIFKSLDDTKEVLWYEESEGIWKHNGEVIIELIARNIWPDISRNGLGEVISKISVHAYVITKREIFDSKRIITLVNGTFDFDTWSFRKHEMTDYSTRKLPVIYEPKATCTMITETLNEWVTQQESQRLIEFLGYCLWPDYHINSALVLVGCGDNGKTTFLNLARAFLGNDNVENLTLQQLQKQFLLSGLYGKLANIASDLPNKGIADTGYFKMLTGNDWITADVKHKGPMRFKNIAKMIFSCNIIPATENDDSIAYYRRWVRTDFPNTFTGEKRKANLLEVLISPRELSGLLNACLEGLKELLKRGVFDTGTYEDQKNAYIAGSDPVKAYVHFRSKIGPTYECPKDELYSDYVLYCKESGKIPLVNSEFSKQLKRWIPNIGEIKKREGGGRRSYWLGVAPLTFAEPETKQILGFEVVE